DCEDLEPRRLLAIVGAETTLAWPYSSASPESPLAADAQAVTGITDPRVIKDGDTYYLFSTGPGIPIHTSTDLVRGRSAGQVFTARPAWAGGIVPGATEYWAPDISFYNGRYHLYYAVSTFGSQRSAIGLATNATLDPAASNYEWVDQGAVI